MRNFREKISLWPARVTVQKKNYHLFLFFFRYVREMFGSKSRYTKLYPKLIRNGLQLALCSLDGMFTCAKFWLLTIVVVKRCSHNRLPLKKFGNSKAAKMAVTQKSSASLRISKNENPYSTSKMFRSIFKFLIKPLLTYHPIRFPSRFASCY